MLDVPKLVRQLLNEVKALSKAPEKPPASMPPRDVLTHVLTELLWASTLLEEGRPCRPRLLYASDAPLHAFDKPIELNRQKLRKLCHAHGPVGYLTWEDTANGPMLTGIHPKYGEHPPGLIFSAPEAMGLDVLWKTARVLSLRGGETRLLTSCQLPNLRKALAGLGETFPGAALETLAPTVQTIVDDAHGGSIWIVAPNAQRVTRMMAVRDGGARMTDEDKVPRQSIGHLASIDGAVVIDTSLKVLGIGAFVASNTQDVMQHQSAGGKPKRVPSKSLGAGRHQAAVSFCKANAPAAALVVSTDGRITLCWCAHQRRRVHSAEVVALGVPLR